MRHVILTCKNHPGLRWGTKEIAWVEGKYNGTRNIFFLGQPTGEGMYRDRSGLHCTEVQKDGRLVEECQCGAAELVEAPEDKQVKREGERTR